MIQNKIDKLTNAELVENLKKLVSTERKILASFLEHLLEVSERRLHIEAGFSNLVDYCTKTFGLSEGSSFKRMQVSRASKKYPLILEYIRDQKLSLSIACLMCPHLSEDNFKERLDLAIGKSKREVEKLIAGWDPRPEQKESLRKAPALFAERESCYPGSGQLKEKDFLLQSPPVTIKKPESVEIITDKRTCLRFSISEKTEEKIKRAKDILVAKKGFSGSLEEIFDIALDALLEKKDPKKRLEKQEKKEVVKTKEVKNITRYIPRKIKDLVLKRSQYQCSYVSPDGRRCNCKTGLQIDHIRPYAKSGCNNEENLQALCRAHNLFKAQLDYGKSKMNQFFK